MFSLAAYDRTHRNIAVTVVVSLLVHGLVFLYAPVRDRTGEEAGAASPAVVPLTVRLMPPGEPATVVPSAAPSSPAPPPPPPRRERILAAREPSATPSPRAVEPPPPEPEPVPAPVTPAPFDMAALIQANRERRRLAEAAAVRGGGGRAPSASESAQANLNRNLSSLARSDGTGGVFQIRRMGAQTAEFAFRGWNRTRRGQWQELIEVQAGPDGDLERAVVRRMIALIREHYSGNFQWESYRLDRVLVLSAAPEDNEGLEEFLLREFFQRRP